jgi:hypothetical protein
MVSNGKISLVHRPFSNYGSHFAETGRNIDELRTANRARIVPRQTGLVVIGPVARGGLEEAVEWKPVHDSPPSQSVATDCLVMDCLYFWRRAKAESALHLPRRVSCLYQTYARRRG